MYRIMRNNWVDIARARTRAMATFADAEAGAAVGVAGAAETHVALGEVEAAMRALPDEQREAVALVLVEGLAYKEAAAVLDGIACRDARGWQLRRTRSDGVSDPARGGYAQAGSALPDLMAAAQDMMAGEPLDAAQEKGRARHGLAMMWTASPSCGRSPTACRRRSGPVRRR